jgi:hypothetical protein
MSVVIGVDPDSKKHGVAVYIDGKLKLLQMMDLMGLMDEVSHYIDNIMDLYPVVHIENVNANKGYWHNKGGSKASFGRSASDMGKCRQAQIEVERMCKHLQVDVVHHKISSKWKSQLGKKEFEKLTGWTGKSNEDTRSAAYFGFVGSR